MKILFGNEYSKNVTYQGISQISNSSALLFAIYFVDLARLNIENVEIIMNVGDISFSSTYGHEFFTV